MALKLLQSGKLLAKAFQNLRISTPLNNILTVNKPNLIPVRSTSFFNKCK